MIKKIVTSIMLAASLISVFANGTVNLAWNAYVGDVGVNTIKLYVASGTNTAFIAGHSNAVATLSVPVAQTSGSITNLPSGTYTAVATAVTTNNIESLDSTNVVFNIIPGGVINFRIISTTTP